MGLEKRIAETLEQAAAGAQRRPGAWHDIDRRIRVARRRRWMAAALVVVLAGTAGAVFVPRLNGRQIPPVTSGWNVFHSARLGMRLLYPPSWSLSEDAEGLIEVRPKASSSANIGTALFRLDVFGAGGTYNDPRYPPPGSITSGSIGKRHFIRADVRRRPALPDVPAVLVTYGIDWDDLAPACSTGQAGCTVVRTLVAEIEADTSDLWDRNSATAERIVRTIRPDRIPTIADVVAKIPVSAHALATGPEGIWALSGGDEKSAGSLYRIDPVKNRVAARIRVGINPLTVGVGNGSVWVVNGEACGVSAPCPDGLHHQFKEEDYNSIWRIDPRTNKVVQKVRYVARDIAFDGSDVWAFTGGSAELIDPKRSVEPLIATASVAGGGPGHIAIGRGYVWVTAGSGNPTPGSAFLSIIDPGKRELVEILDAPGVVVEPDVTVAFGSAWVSTSRAAGVGELLRIDPATRRQAADIALPGVPAPGDDPVAVAAGNGYVWVLGSRGYLWRIDPATNIVVAPPVRVSDGTSTRASGVVTGFGSVWATSADGFIWRMTP